MNTLQSAHPELMTKVGPWHDGTRVRHYVDKNSVKFYNQQNVLRIEMTMNNPQKCLVQFSLLRSHGIIRKLPKQHKYVLTDKGRKNNEVRYSALSCKIHIRKFKQYRCIF